jgi:hypothetical protein
MHTSSSPLALALGGALALTLTACGGGSSSDDTAPPAPAPDTKVTLTGTVVVDQAIRNAIVCLDLNNNGTCDATEPVSARTGADGAYTLTYDTAQTSATQAAAASLIAPMVPGALADANTTIDAADTTEGNTATRYVLRQVPGKAGQINPLTTLVTAGITAGMTEAAARSNAALQLAIAPAKIDNYQDDAPTAGVMLDSARSMAKVVAASLEEGTTLVVGDQQSAVTAATGDLSSFIYTDSANYSYRTIDSVAKPSGTAGSTLRDVRGGMTAGSPTPASTLYNQAYLTAAGWQRCDDTILLQSTIGSPSRNTFCGALSQVGFTKREDVDTRTMASVVSSLQTDADTNTINNNGTSTAALLTSLGTATFPAGSRIHTRYNLSLDQPVLINSIAADSRPASETTLEQMITARPASAVVLSTGAGTLSLGISSGPARALRVAFTGTTSPTAGTVQFYECDLNSTQTVLSNCATTQTGTYAIATVHGVKVMRFAGHAATTMGHTRSYAEVANAPTIVSGSRVFQVRENKTDIDSNFTTSRRLNAAAWTALRAQAGI